MSGRFNNRNYLAVFLILAVVYIVTKLPSVKRADRSLNTDIVHIDTSQVSSMEIYPAGEKESMLEFTRTKGAWRVKKDEVIAAANIRSFEGLLAEIQNLEAEQLVARSPERWAEYNVNDSLGTRIIVKEGDKITLDLVVGRFNYTPPPQNSYNPYGQNQVSGKTYVRLWAGDEVYSVDGFLSMSINRPFDQWRNQTITRFSTSGLSRIAFDYPADSGFIAERTDAGWMVAGILADSTSMAGYLNRISSKSHQQFADHFQPGPEPDYRIVFEGDNMQQQFVRAYVQADGNMVLNSSINPETWFSVARDGLFGDLYPGYEELLPH